MEILMDVNHHQFEKSANIPKPNFQTTKRTIKKCQATHTFLPAPATEALCQVNPTALPPQGQHQHQTAQPYGAPSAPYGAPPSAPYGAPYAPEKPYNPDKPHKNQGGGGGYPAPGPGYGSPFAALVPSVFPPGTDPNVIACF
ncbi:hypothetical protein DVH24_019498 [Malus domestica]|uniref:Uncharacterized protein n=1 Tax=Malus domestica TaxID=3750 RepID=A0A498I0J0_MALDO|nr:probable calcium-binding protein CML49 [Malus domestica]RXH76610.1 hypothetical protein DVH24_019498 [Malus domestica]